MADARNFEDLMLKYSQEDKATWDDCLIAGAKLVLFFEFCNEDSENPKTPNVIKKFREKIALRSNNDMEKILELATQNNLTLDSTISVERAAIAYFEYQKNIFPRSQPNIILQKAFYSTKYISKTATASS